MPKERVDVKEALKVMLPLIKDYLRLGAYAGADAVVDRQFDTTDVLIVLPVSAIDARYFSHLGEPDEVPPHAGSRRAEGAIEANRHRRIGKAHR